MRAVEASLKQNFNGSQASYEKDKAQWEDDQFESLQGDHAKEVAADPERFLTKYFFKTDRATPNQSQSPITIIGRHFTTLQPPVTKIFGARVAPIVCDAGHITLIGWQQDMSDAIRKEFLKVRSQMSSTEEIATAEANIDLKRFLVKDFGFEPNGTLKNGNLSAKPVTLRDFLKDPYEVSDITLAALEFVISSVSDSTRSFVGRFYVCGWKSDVDRQVQRIEAENRRIKDEKKRILALQHEAGWQDILTSYAEDIDECTVHRCPLQEEQLAGT